MNEAPVHLTQIHSRYDPIAEADRYIQALNLSKDIQFFILIEPGLGYLAKSLQKHCGACKIIIIHIDEKLKPHIKEDQDIPAWYPGSGETIQGFLGREIPESPASSIRIIEWRPSLRLYGKVYLEALREAADFVKRSDASYRTGLNFSRRWVRNFFKNLKLIRKVMLYRTTGSSIIVTGSGPSLEKALPRIRQMAKNSYILAASSSVQFLAQNGISADLVISTDGGSWALKHLYSGFRFSSNITGLAVNLCASLPSQCSKFPFLILNDGTYWQTIVLHELGLPSVIIPQRGTVTASAAELALTLSSANVYLAGMDLTVRDIQSHARPYAFDYLLYGCATRFKPLYCQYFKRSRNISGGGSLDVYASWFRERLKNWPKRIFSLDSDNTIFPPAFPSTDNAKRENFLETESSTGASGDYCKRACSALVKALDEPQYGETLTRELSSLLFPGIEGTGKKEIISELDAIEGPCGD